MLDCFDVLVLPDFQVVGLIEGVEELLRALGAADAGYEALRETGDRGAGGAEGCFDGGEEAG